METVVHELENLPAFGLAATPVAQFQFGQIGGNSRMAASRANSGSIASLRVHDLRGAANIAEIFNLGKVEHWTRTDKGAAANLAPDLPFIFQYRHGFTQSRARQIELKAEFALGWQSVVEGQLMRAHVATQAGERVWIGWL